MLKITPPPLTIDDGLFRYGERVPPEIRQRDGVCAQRRGVDVDGVALHGIYLRIPALRDFPPVYVRPLDGVQHIRFC